MNKRILLSVLWIICATIGGLAQDVIVKQDKSTILAKILKVTASEIEYKRFSNPNGPTYTIPVTDVVSINYENGEKDTFESSNSSVRNQVYEQSSTSTPSRVATPSYATYSKDNLITNQGLSLYQQKEDLLSKSRTYKTLGGVTMFLGFGAAVAGIVCAGCGVDEVISYSLCGGGGVIGCVGAITWAHGRNLKNKANTIRVTSIIEKDFQIGKGITFTPGINLMALHSESFYDYAVGVGASIKF